MKKLVEESIVDYLIKKNLKITTVESCTGGMIASRIVNVSGASAVFEQGYVTYSNEAKQKMVNVNKDTIEKYNVVSNEVAEEMAKGALKVSGADVAVSVTGYAGPMGGTDEIPVGTVCIGVCYKEKCFAEKFVFEGDRQCIRESACEKAFELVHDMILML